MGRKLKQLTVVQLKSELNKRNLNTSGGKNDLLLRLEDAMDKEGQDPNTFSFDVDEEEQVGTGNEMTEMMQLICQSIQNMEQKFDEQKKSMDEQKKSMDEQKNGLKELDSRLEQKFDEQKKSMDEQKNSLEQRLDDQRNMLQQKFADIDNKFEKIEKNVDDKFELVENKFEQMTKELDAVRNQKVRECTLGSPARKELKPPSFNGETSWSTYKKQFEVAACANNWDNEEKCIALTMALHGPAAELLQTVDVEKHKDYMALVQAIETRFGDSHMKEVYKVQLQSRVQQRGETLQQLQADVSRLAHLSYPTAGQEIIGEMAKEAFIRGITDSKLQSAVRMAGKKTLAEALAFALEMEAANQASRGTHFVREVTSIECSCARISAEEQNRTQETRRMRCWNCNKIGHLQRQCMEPRQVKRCPHCETSRNTQQASQTSRPRTIIQVSLAKRCNESLLVEVVNAKERWMATIDTGATASIIRRDLVQKSWLHNTSSYSLRTATGETARVYGEVRLQIHLAGIAFSHAFLVADIYDECIIGIDFMKEHGLVVDIGAQTLRYRNMEIPMVYGNANTSALKVVICQNEMLKPSSETIVWAKMEGGPGSHRFFLMEPENKREFIVGKTLVEPKNSMVPVRVLNSKAFSVQIRKGEHVGKCVPVDAISTITETSGSVPVPAVVRTKLKGKILGQSELDHQQSFVAKQIIDEYADIFATQDGEYGRTHLVQHQIDTGDSRPIRQPARRLPLAKQAEVSDMVAKMKSEGLIEESQSPWASPVVLVKKKDGSTRFCVDYRRLNDVTKKDSYPLPRIDDTLDMLSGARWFSTLDLKSGYWQVEIHQKDREKTAFTTGSGLWQFTVMPFGLCNAPATFERLMERTLQGLTWKTCLVYLDDVIVIGKTFEEHRKNLREVFQRIRSAHLKLNPEKCALFRSEVKYLGHIIMAEGVRTDPEKIEAVKSWPAPTDKHQLRSFLGLATYYRRFVKDFARIAKSLHQLTEKGRKFKWSGDCEMAFQELKRQLCNAPVLAYPTPGKLFIVDADASNVGVGAVISQVHDGQEKVIAYYSKVLSKAERNYCVTRRELLALILATKHFHKYLYGQKFILRTDHAALKWLLHFKNPEGQVARWIEQLQGYDFDVQHRKGKLHSNADALSRRPCGVKCEHCNRKEERELSAVQRIRVEPERGWTTEQIRSSQQEDTDIEPILAWKEHDERPSWQEISDRSQTLKAYWAQWNSLCVQDGVLKRKWESADGETSHMQLIVPRSKIREVLREIHDGASGGHLGINKTLEKVRERFYWLSARQDVEEWCKKCITCAATKGPRVKPQGKMQQYNVGAPFERIAIDVAGPFPETTNGNRYTLVVMDYFSKWPEVFAIPNQEAKTVAEEIINNWVSRFGVPKELHADQGRNFESKVFQEMCEYLGIKKTRTTPLHPQSDGMVERFNRTLKEHLSKVVDDCQRDWDRHIPLFLMAYRNAVHSSTGYTPSEILFGQTVRLPSEAKFGSPPTESKECSEYVSDLRTRMRKTHENTRGRIKLTSNRMKTRYDIQATSSGFNEGDLVWLYNPQRKKGISPKLQQDWEGPYKVIKRINDVVYRIQRGDQRKLKVVHVDRMCHYKGEVNDGAVRDEQL